MVIRSVGPGSLAPGVSRHWRASYLHRITALMPFGVTVAHALLFQAYLAVPMYESPTGMLVAAFALGLATIGVALLWRARTPWVALFAVVAFTIPALLMLLLGPAAILILQNMA